MKTQNSPNVFPTALAAVVVLILLASAWVYGRAATPDEHAAHHPPPATANDAPEVSPAPPPPPPPLAGKARGKMGQGGMKGGMMGMKQQMMKGGSDDQSKGPATKSGGCTCGMMAGTDDEPARAGQPALGPGRAAAAKPGVAGTSHLFSIGAAGFFLNHDGLIALTPAQAKALRQLREQAFLEQAEFGRKLASSEQALWVLLTAEAPDSTRISAQLNQAESLRTARRLAHVKAVLAAMGTLTDAQRDILLGAKAPASQP